MFFYRKFLILFVLICSVVVVICFSAGFALHFLLIIWLSPFTYSLELIFVLYFVVLLFLSFFGTIFFKFHFSSFFVLLFPITIHILLFCPFLCMHFSFSFFFFYFMCCILYLFPCLSSGLYFPLLIPMCLFPSNFS